ncbi:MAG TPA: hypothetical protein VEC35_10770 [Noviherbaspirillum sp.]|nr:hypothetical protein [Noviherbaspirillum sp.]
MLSKPSAIALLASVFGPLAAGVALAADLSIPPTSKSAKALQKPAADKRVAQKAVLAKADKAKRQDAQRRILTYNLYQDPLFKLNGAVTDKRHFGAPHVLDKFGTGFGNSVPAVPSMRPTRQAALPELKVAEQESLGIDFGCGDKPFRGRAVTKELTACYKHDVDRSWKTQTYLSREYVEGTQKWGGGLAVRYAY